MLIQILCIIRRWSIEEITPKTCVFDFDSVLYGASSLPEQHNISVTHKATGWNIKLKNKTEFYKWLSDQNKVRGGENQKPLIIKNDFTIESESKIIMSDKVPKEHIEASIEAIRNKPWCKELIIVVGGKGNFRNDIIDNYKAGRPPKPQRFVPLRNWLVDAHKPLIRDNCEADDVIGWFGWEAFKKALKSGNKDSSDVVMVGIDKDTKQVPGWHFNNKKGGKNPVWVSPFEADRNFFTQMLLGDATDNISALPMVKSDILWYKNPKKEWSGCGEKTAKYLINQCQDTKEMLSLCEELYQDYFNVAWKYKISTAFSLLRLMEEEGVIPDYFKYKEMILNG